MKNILYTILFIITFCVACSSYKMTLTKPIFYPTYNELYDNILSKKYDTLLVQRNLKTWGENIIISADKDTVTQYFLYLPIDKYQEKVIYINKINFKEDSIYNKFEYIERNILKNKK